MKPMTRIRIIAPPYEMHRCFFESNQKHCSGVTGRTLNMLTSKSSKFSNSRNVPMDVNKVADLASNTSLNISCKENS
jgi:hypothetical protein